MADASTFDLFEFVSGQSYPEELVPVYVDRKSVYEIDKLEAEIADEVDSDKANELDARIKVLNETVRETALTFHLRGIPSPVVIAVEKKIDAKFGEESEDPERFMEKFNELIALHIQYVSRPDGSKDERSWDRESVAKLFETLPAGQAAKLLDATVELSIRARAFENYTVTPDFS